MQSEEKIDLVSADDIRDASLLKQIFGKQTTRSSAFSRASCKIFRTKHTGDANCADLNEKKQLVFSGSGSGMSSYKTPQFPDAGDLLVTLDLFGRDEGWDVGAVGIVKGRHHLRPLMDLRLG